MSFILLDVQLGFLLFFSLSISARSSLISRFFLVTSACAVLYNVDIFRANTAPCLTTASN